MELGQFETVRRCLRIKEPVVYADDEILDDHLEGKRTFNVEEKLHDEKFSENLKNIILELNGSDFDLRYVQEHGFNTPILFKSKEGLGLRMPDPMLFSVIDVKSYVGPRRVIEVFDCDTHEPDMMTVHNWVRYYTGTERDRILNVTSLEFSHTGLQRIVECPTVVRDNLDWVSLVWPEHLINDQKDATNTMENMKYPKVRNYVLMSIAGCYTDFHIDFGGTSVWYHVLKGAKVFWLVPPSENNLEVYEEWVLSGRQSDIFFGDLVNDCYRVHLVSGDTFMIPTGWIHGVYTPVDSLVFGGNFLHSFNIPLQLKVYDIEENTHVPRKLRFPFFAEIHWYMIKSYVDVLERDLDERRIREFEAHPDDGAFKLVKDEMNNVKNEKPISKWQCVHLTDYELEGLNLICERFRRWSYAKLNYPNDLKEDSMELIDRLEELLQHHEDDDQILACSGVNFFEQLKVERTDKNKFSPLNTPLHKQEFPASCAALNEDDDERNETSQKEENGMFKSEQVRCDNKEIRTDKNKIKTRRVRCNNCKGCKIENCNTCRFCLDMRRNGGEGKLKKPCELRYCSNPQLPKDIECKICGKGKNNDTSLVLMECCICGEVVHHSCLKSSKPYKISKLNNSWECPNCYKTKNIQNPCKLIKDEKKITNGDIKVQNLKNLIQMSKIKVIKKDSDETSVYLKRERMSHKDGDNNSGDDEPIIKKKISYSSDDKPLITVNEQRSETEDTKPLLLLEIQKPCVQSPMESSYVCRVLDKGGNHSLPRFVWMKVFSYLSKRDVCNCMLVCKDWKQWCHSNKEIGVLDKSVTPTLENVRYNF